MKQVLAIGSRLFVRRLTLGGAAGRVVEPPQAARALRQALEHPMTGLVLVESRLLDGLRGELLEGGGPGKPVVVAVGDSQESILRRQIGRVLGADLLAKDPAEARPKEVS